MSVSFSVRHNHFSFTLLHNSGNLKKTHENSTGFHGNTAWNFHVKYPWSFHVFSEIARIVT